MSRHFVEVNAPGALFNVLDQTESHCVCGCLVFSLVVQGNISGLPIKDQKRGTQETVDGPNECERVTGCDDVGRMAFAQLEREMKRAQESKEPLLDNAAEVLLPCLALPRRGITRLDSRGKGLTHIEYRRRSNKKELVQKEKGSGSKRKALAMLRCSTRY